MAINYRAEVDSGFDRKRIVETSIIEMLKAGIPIDIITKGEQFNFRHHEMANNLQYGYDKKMEEYTELYELYGVDPVEVSLPDRYSEVAHPIGGELYPMTPKEEKEKFKLRDSIRRQIENSKGDQTKRYEKEMNKAATALTRLKTKYPIIDRIIALVEDMDQLDGFTPDSLIRLFKHHNLNVKERFRYEKLYAEYQQLMEQFKDASIRYENACNGIVNASEIYQLTAKLNEVETEIIQRNTKLVNGFIRQKYSSLYVEAEELFQVCYIAMWEAVRVHDYTTDYKFSTIAYAYMDLAVKKNFKSLTGYKWDDYWAKRKIEVLLKTIEEQVGYKVSVNDLIDFGLIDLTEAKVVGLHNMIQVFSASELYDLSEESYEAWEENAKYQESHGDDEVLDYQTLPEETVEDVLSEAFNSLLHEEIMKVLQTLTPREEKVIIYRFGLDGEREHTLEETGQLFDVTRERIRQIEAKALRKLRHPMRSKKLKDYL